MGDKFGDTRVELILDLKKNDFFLEKTYNGKDSFLQRKWPYSLGKTILFVFRRFFVARQNRHFACLKVGGPECFLGVFFSRIRCKFCLFFSFRRKKLQRIYNGFS